MGFREVWLLLLGSWLQQLRAPDHLPGLLLCTHQATFRTLRATLAPGRFLGPLMSPLPAMMPMRWATLERIVRPLVRLASTPPRLPLTTFHRLLTAVLPAFCMERARTLGGFNIVLLFSYYQPPKASHDFDGMLRALEEICEIGDAPTKQALLKALVEGSQARTELRKSQPFGLASSFMLCKRRTLSHASASSGEWIPFDALY